MTRGLFALALAGACAVSACGGARPHSRAAGAVSPLAVKPVAFVSANVPQMRSLRAVADAGNVIAVFGDDRATMHNGSGAVVAMDTSVKGWVDAGTIPGADGSADWIVGIDGRGHLYHLRGLHSFEDVTERYGLGGQRVREAAVLGQGFVGFLLDKEIAVTDGTRVTRYEAGPFVELAGGGGFAVGVGPAGLTRMNAATMAVDRFALPGVTHAVLGRTGLLYATTPRALYAQGAGGELAMVYEADGDTLHGLVSSGDHVWFADGRELGLVDGGKVEETVGKNIPIDARLSPSPSGDVWVVGKGSLERYARAETEPMEGRAWSTTLAPIFARSCAACHGPGGESGTDLSTAEAWQTNRAEIYERVVVQRSMPPAGHPLSDADRAVIESYAASPF